MAEQSAMSFARMQDLAAQFWQWWIAELTGMMPEFVKRILFGGQVYQIVVEGDELAIRRVVKGAKGVEPVMVGLIDPSGLGRERLLLQDARRVELILPPEGYLKKRLILPRVAESNLREVLTFQLEQETPFRLSQVYFDSLCVARNRGSQTLTIDLYVAPKGRVDLLLEQLSKHAIRLDAVTVDGEIAGESLKLNLMPGEQRRRGYSFARRLNYLLAGLVLLLGLSNLLFPLWEKSVELERLQLKAAQLKQQVVKARELRERVDTAKNEAGFILEKRMEHAPVLEVINELTHLLPDNTWLDQLEIDAGDVQVHGFSASASTLISLLESSNSFSDARFRSSITKNAINDMERFHLSAQFVTEATR